MRLPPPWPDRAAQRPIKSHGANSKTYGADRQMWKKGFALRNRRTENLDWVQPGFPCQTIRKPIETIAKQWEHIGKHQQTIANHKKPYRKTKENQRNTIEQP